MNEILQFITHLDPKKLPDPIDATVLERHGLKHHGNLDALRFMGFITDENRPTGVLQLVTSKNGQELWRKEFWSWVIVAYSPCLYGLDPSFCTEADLRTQFAAHLGQGQEAEAEAAVQFYLDLRQALGPRTAASACRTPQAAPRDSPAPQPSPAAVARFQIPLAEDRQAVLQLPADYEQGDLTVVMAAIDVLRQSLPH